MATRGNKASGGTDFQTGWPIDPVEVNTDFNNAFAGVNNITIADANVLAGANIDPSKIGDYSADDTEYGDAAAPATRVHATNYTVLTTSKPTDLEGEVKRFRYLFEEAFPGIISNTTGLPVADQWYAMTGKGVLLPPTGTLWPSFLSTAPSGWLLMSDGTIGNAASGATARANTDTRELYRMWWRMFSDTICPVSSGRGADPDADFDVNKTLRMPLLVGRVIGVAGTPASANRIDAVTGTQGVTGTTPVAGSSSTVFFIDPASSSNVNSDYVGQEIRFTSGVLSGNVQTISDYNAETHEITVDTSMGGTVAAGVTYVIYPLNNSMFNLSWASGPTVDDALNGYTIEITGGTGTLESRTIADYDASERKITITGTWTTNPDHTTTYSIYKTLTTRSAGASLGTESHIPTLATLAAHRHSVKLQTGGATANTGTVKSGDTLANIDDTQTSAINDMGNGASVSLFQPTAFVNWICKL